MIVTILLICIPVALGAGLLWGFALCAGIQAAKHPRFHGGYEDETAARLAQQAWEKHWAATRDSEQRAAEQAYAMGLNTQGDFALHRTHEAAMKADQAAFDQANARYSAPLKPNADGDLKTVWMHTHVEH
jgi:hypothetical protein